MASLANTLPTIHLIEDGRPTYDAQPRHRTMIADDVVEAVAALGTNALGLYCYLERLVGKDGTWTITVRNLAATFNCTERHIQDQMTKLIDAGFVERIAHTNRFGMQQANTWRLPYHMRTDGGEQTGEHTGERGGEQTGEQKVPFPFTPLVVTVDTSSYNVEEEPPISPKGEKPKKTLRALPDDFEVPMDDWTAMMTEQRMSDHDLTVETERFKDYCLTHGKRYRDWLAAWRNWMRSPYRKPVPVANGTTPHIAKSNGHDWKAAAQRLEAERSAKRQPPEPDNVIDAFYR